MITALKNTLVAAYQGACTHTALFSTAPTSTTPGTELTGGSPAYARIPTGWAAPANGVGSFGPLPFNVPSGATVAGAGFYNALTAGTYQDGGALTAQAFSSQGVYNLSGSMTES